MQRKDVSFLHGGNLRGYGNSPAIEYRLNHILQIQINLVRQITVFVDGNIKCLNHSLFCRLCNESEEADVLPSASSER
ncbi:MAG TPA: hypothetical protein PKD52_00005 [Clostridiales bacterium]|nr:hypothetical protein [Clostridiales bacterium]